MTVSKIRLNGTDHDIRAKYLIQSSSSDAMSEEFVTKTTTEDAIANIQKIYGNTVKWNQLVQNGNFDGATSWSTINSTVTTSNHVATLVRGSQSMGGFLFNPSFSANTTHLYYIAATLSSQTSGVDMNYGFHTTSYTVGGNTILSCSTSSKQRVSGIVSPKNTTDRIAARIGASASAAGSTGTIENAICVDLTMMYGAGSEPTVSEFESEFNQPYYDYNPSGLLSVKATAIQSKDSNNNVIGNCDLNIPTLTGKLNGTGSSVVIFPDGMQLNGTTRDELTATSAIKRIAEDNSVLSTPQTYILDNALQLQYPVVAGGTEMVLPTTGTAPMKMDVIYGNAADAAATMSQNFISVDSMKEFLAALGTQMNGTWAMQYSGGKYTFTFTSN